MKYVIFMLIGFMVASAQADTEKTPLGVIDFDKDPEKIFLNGKEITVPADDELPISIYPEKLPIKVNGRRNSYFLLRYTSRYNGRRVRKFMILDLSGSQPIFSNAIMLNENPSVLWGDNNYIYHRDGSLYFGVYSPARKQFIYKNGVISENTGPWAGPDKPEKYIEPEPEDRGPCYGVPGGLEECMEDINRNSPEKVLKE